MFALGRSRPVLVAVDQRHRLREGRDFYLAKNGTANWPLIDTPWWS